MKKNLSPWLHQLERTRESIVLDRNLETDILVVGGGIAGVTTAYTLLRDTKHTVTLIDSYLVGHGASGHNAGQLTTYFERPLADIASQFGVDLACAAQKNVESAWLELDKIQQEVDLKTPIYKFTGYAGMTQLSQVISHLADNMIRHDGGIPIEKMLIADDFEFLNQIPGVFSHLYEITTKENLKKMLETGSDDYVAMLVYPKGATNSAKICEELIEYMLETYADRFNVYEKTPANRIILDKDSALTEVVFNKNEMVTESATPDVTITSKKVILCTNGFEGFSLVNNAGKDIDTKFHHQLYGRINFMSAYLDSLEKDPVAISYFPKKSSIHGPKDTITGEQYFYITRRPHMHNGVEMGLISTGGPERILKEGEFYNRNDMCEPWAEQDVDAFLKENYKKHPGEKVEYQFCWHGLLGYTTTGLRLIGEEPLNRVLIYNLGCNGVGIMPSIYGSTRISQIVQGIQQEPSIFDPQVNI
jgi:glycine/D-amino acid oxidase-like deaminating enzyme